MSRLRSPSSGISRCRRTAPKSIAVVIVWTVIPIEPRRSYICQKTGIIPRYFGNVPVWMLIASRRGTDRSASLKICEAATETRRSGASRRNRSTYSGALTSGTTRHAMP